MKAQVIDRCPDVADFADIVLGQGSLDLARRLPDSEISPMASLLVWRDAWRCEARQIHDAPKGFEDIATVAPSMACDEDTAVTLTDREGWGSVSMRGAATHGNIAGPSTVQSGYQVAESG